MHGRVHLAWTPDSPPPHPSRTPAASAPSTEGISFEANPGAQAGGRANTAGIEDCDDSDGDYVPPSDDSSPSGISDSDDLDSDDREGFEEICAFEDL